tara:strand:+ start:5095 stop:6093 length:999 start_codon:yes stop_codon:yes gene_type:complete
MVEINKSTSRLYSRLGQSGAAFAIGLVEAAQSKSDIVALTADYEKPAGMTKFATQYPKNFFNVGIAEQNLVGVAAGFANEGLKTIASCQACFLSMRSFEQVRQYAGYMKLPIVFVGVSSGYALTFFGNTHYAVEDVSLMRSIPGMNIISPSDSGQAAKALVAALEINKPVYIRCTGDQSIKPIYNEDFSYNIGKSITLNEGKEIVVFSSGAITRNVLDAVNKIKEEKDIDIKLVDMHTICPLDKDSLQENMSAKIWISVEEHYISGGLGTAISEFLINSDKKRKPRIVKIGIKNRYVTPGDYKFLLESNNLDSESIYEKLDECQKLLKKIDE